MKKILSTLVLVASVALFAAGCASNPTTQKSIISTARVAAFVGTSEALVQHPEWQPKFELAAAQLATLEASTNLDAATLLAIAQQLPVKELKSDQARIYITAATLLISDYASAVPLEKIGELKPVAAAIREGITMALPPKF